MTDISLGAFSVFFTQSPSFLSFQRTMLEAQGISNCQTIFQLEKIPSDNHIRSILDTVNPDYLFPVFTQIFHTLNEATILNDFRSFQNDILIAIDGTQYFTSKKIHCDSCLEKHHKDGIITYHHNLLASAIISPNIKKAIALWPCFIKKNDGETKTDSEQEAAKRWIDRWGPVVSPLSVTITGDDLHAHQPVIQKILDQEMNFLFVCKPKSHKFLYEWLPIKEDNGELFRKQVKKWNGKENLYYYYRYANNMPLRNSDDLLHVNWVEVEVKKENGTIVYTNAFITNHFITDDNVEACVAAGRAKWKIENENNNTLKTKGYNLEHNFGHGKENLSEILAVLNILAFLFHTILGLCDKRYQLIRKTLPRRDRFFHDVKALTTYFCFDDWNHLLKTMLKGLKLEDPG